MLNAKSLIILMALPFPLLVLILFYRDRQPFAAHVVFSLHLHASCCCFAFRLSLHLLTCCPVEWD